MRFFSHLGLKGRTTAGSTLLLLLTVAGLSSAFMWRGYRASLERLRQYAVTQAKAVSYSAEPYVLLNQGEALRSVLKAAASDETIEFASVLDTKGRVLTSFQRNWGFQPEIPIDLQNPFGARAAGDDPIIAQSANQLLVAAPIWSGTSDIALDLPDPDRPAEEASRRVVGYVILIHGLQGLRSELAGAIPPTLIIAGVVLLVGITLNVLFVRQFLRPIHDLVKTAREIQAGDLNRRAATDAVGEVGILAGAFNQMAETLNHYTQDLENQVRRRTFALQESEAEARKLALAAESANRAKSDFLANMSHEIRTPMTAILGFAESLDSPLTESERHEAISTIRRNGEHLLQIINDILDISKIEAGKLHIQSSPCSLCQVVCEVASLMRARAESKGLSFSVIYRTPTPETIQTDATRLRQVLINLVNNAVKFTEQGSIRLEVQTLLDERGGPIARFSVIDTGVGMDPEQMAGLFQPFTQVDTSMTRRFGGTGLGLAISKRIVAMLGGTLSVASTPGEGSTFTLSIPIGPMDNVRMLANPGEVLHERPVAPPRQPATPKLDCRILLAEDGPDNQRLIAFLLKKAGAEVEIAENGKIAVEKAMAAQQAGRRFDVILMDMQMPILDGYGATRLLRQNAYSAPIIALTAHAMAGDREKCLEAGCSDFCTKPIDKHHLIVTIRSYLSKEQPQMDSGPSTLSPIVSELADDSDFSDLIELFITELPARIAGIQEAMQSQDLDRLRMLAHQLKGAAGGYGFPTITDAARGVEDAVKIRADLNQVRERIEALAGLCGRARAKPTTEATP